MEWGAWKSNANENKLNPGQIHTIPGLPEETHIAYHDLTRHHNRPPQTSTGRGGGPPKPGDQPPRVPLIEGSIALMFNTCDDLEHPFINYLENQMGIPVWGIGPLFSDKYWASIKSNTLIHDLQIRNLTYQKEDQVKQWLDSKSQESVLYVAFGSELSPTNEELNQLASALEEIDYPFIWVIQNRLNLSENEEKSEGFFGLDDKIGERGLIIQGWAPQLLILSHKSIGGFLSHCGWNSIVEAIGLGVPILAWPIRGDQIYNAKLVVNYLKIGYLALPSGSPEMVKMDLLNGIEKVALTFLFSVFDFLETIPNKSYIALLDKFFLLMEQLVDDLGSIESANYRMERRVRGIGGSPRPDHPIRSKRQAWLCSQSNFVTFVYPSDGSPFEGSLGTDSLCV
ncbi:UDP-glycosyltransferase 73B5-like [Olea europaea var. sylvestris]|uniref:UDP-glycosyltransferase 73B5-like n=1 Tax=Olea europaea var. sylvestris TaxID=158386 RepID=UPI000C1D3446|nr:UDP-glycosyltransferase 73B5-like [Olea europaea var. sylvestris]